MSWSDFVSGMKVGTPSIWPMGTVGGTSILWWFKLAGNYNIFDMKLPKQSHTAVVYLLWICRAWIPEPPDQVQGKYWEIIVTLFTTTTIGRVQAQGKTGNSNSWRGTTTVQGSCVGLCVGLWSPMDLRTFNLSDVGGWNDRLCVNDINWCESK